MDWSGAICFGTIILILIAFLAAGIQATTPKPCQRCGAVARLDVKTHLCPDCLALPWYKDELKTVHIGSYHDTGVMQRDIEAALANGWVITSTSGIGGHINLGRTATAAMLTAGLSLMVKPSRQKDKIIVTFQRDKANA